MRPGIEDLRALAALVLGLLLISAGVARAEGVESFVVGGVGFRVPAGFVVAPTGASRSVMLRFHLPDFGVVDDRAFAGVYPEDDRPVLTVEISDDVSVPVGQVWLDQEIAYADAVKASCWHCENDFSALGGIEYDTFDGIGRPPNGSQLPAGGLFRLFEYPNSSGSFAVCFFAPDGAGKGCEFRERLGRKLTIYIRFPIEFLSQGLLLVGNVNTRLAGYEMPNGVAAIEPLLAGVAPPMCWKPPGPFVPERNFPLKIGPETWHIPPAYAATFGSNQTQDPAYDSFHLWLKLPDLEPLTAADPSPVLIAGPGDYIGISFEFDNRTWTDEPRATFVKRYLMGLHHIGRNSFFDYDQYQSILSKDVYSSSNQIFSVSKDVALNAESFPPEYFICYFNGSVPEPGCDFHVVGLSPQKLSVNQYAGVYRISYGISQAWFSQMMRINACVQKLYEEFRYNRAP